MRTVKIIFNLLLNTFYLSLTLILSLVIFGSYEHSITLVISCLCLATLLVLAFNYLMRRNEERQSVYPLDTSFIASLTKGFFTKLIFTSCALSLVVKIVNDLSYTGAATIVTMKITDTYRSKGLDYMVLTDGNSSYSQPVPLSIKPLIALNSELTVEFRKGALGLMKIDQVYLVKPLPLRNKIK